MVGFLTLTICGLRQTHATLLLMAGIHPKVVSERYFEGQDPLFPTFSETLDQILQMGKRLVEAYNLCYVVESDRESEPTKPDDQDAGAHHSVGSSGIDTSLLRSNSNEKAKSRLHQIADRARAEAYDFVGDSLLATDLMMRHL